LGQDGGQSLFSFMSRTVPKKAEEQHSAAHGRWTDADRRQLRTVDETPRPRTPGEGMTELDPTPDDIAAREMADTHSMLELAHVIRRAARIRPFGPNSRAVHEAGGTVMLTPAEAEDAAQAVLKSKWLTDHVNAAVKKALSDAADDWHNDETSGHWHHTPDDGAILIRDRDEGRTWLRDRAAQYPDIRARQEGL
jgi:hypothetical protein